MKSHPSEEEVTTPGSDFCLRKEDIKTLLEILSWQVTPEEQVKYLTDDCFGTNRTHLHEEGNKYDRWNSPDNVDYGLSELMDGCSNLPIYTVRAIFKWLREEMNNEPYTNSPRLWMYRYWQALKQENLSQEEFLNNHEWFITTPYYLNDNDVYQSNIFKYFIRHPSCPVDEILKACNHEDAWVRQAAINNPNCPTEGRVLVALTRGLPTPDDSYR